MSAADLSTLLVWFATTAFTITLLAWTLDLARIAERSAARRPAVAPAAVPVGAAVGLGGTPPTDDPAAGGDRRADRSPFRSARAEGIGRSTNVLGVALLLAGIALRGVAAGRWPTANMYEFTLVGVVVAMGVLAVVQRRRALPFIAVVVSGISVLSLALALLVFYVQAEAVQPALQSYWLVLHVGVAIIATGVFTVGFASSVLQVLRESRETDRSHLDGSWGRVDPLRRALSGWKVTGRRFAWLEQVPDARSLESLTFRLHSIGFVLWTFTLIGGAIWAEHAWGRYWGWDPKEVGTFVAWVVYAAYLHARTTRGWSGRRAAYIVWVGYAVVLANFTVINLVVTGKHSYSGLG
ncbi:MAG: c-type cytochrome biogenesis protein CcsB [Cellulomonas sp.]|nr:c-type cytochrome biogenesis protein CcsB [Cellulomonas sp.]